MSTIVSYMLAIVHIKMYSRVSVVKKAVWCTSVLFTETASLPFSTPHISLYNHWADFYQIYILIFMPSVYTTLHTKLEGNQPNSLLDICS